VGLDEVKQMQVDHPDPDLRLYRPCELEETIRNARDGVLNYVAVDNRYLVPWQFFPRHRITVCGGPFHDGKFTSR
jgi:hypothetical protein